MNDEQQKKCGERELYIIYFLKCLKVIQCKIVTDRASFPSVFMVTPFFKKRGGSFCQKMAKLCVLTLNHIEQRQLKFQDYQSIKNVQVKVMGQCLEHKSYL